MEQYQDAAYGLQRGSDRWRTLCEGPAAPPGESPGLLCPFHLHTPRSRDVFPTSPGVEFSWKCQIDLGLTLRCKRSSGYSGELVVMAAYGPRSAPPMQRKS